MSDQEVDVDYRLYLIAYFQATKATHHDKDLNFLKFTPQNLTVEVASAALAVSLGVYHGLYGRPPLNFPQFKVRCSQVDTSRVEGFETASLN